MDLVRMFVNGQGMRGGEFNDAFSDARFVGEVFSAPRYRFYAVRDTFPGLHPAQEPELGRRVLGEVYELPYLMLAERLLPREPPELELTVIELEDGTGSLSMRMRDDAVGAPGVVDISDVEGGWRAYRG
ncbi:hypothetical protein ACIB24_10575 [Spongisporangium articulatum]|uniref:Allophanate hydrolase C-terminal domain-containing protein n=1 Tax=Spongisporangium articulatum TaxID=3362603 RepID=A0ABW8AM99_9ACTN